MGRKKKAYVVDIDGTLADSEMCHLYSEEVRRGDFTWFHSKVGTFAPIMGIVQIIRELRKRYEILYVTYRGENLRWDTATWLDRYGIASRHLYMRDEADIKTSSVDYKRTVIIKLFEKFDIVGAFEDNMACAHMFKSLDIPTCLILNKSKLVRDREGREV